MIRHSLAIASLLLALSAGTASAGIITVPALPAGSSYLTITATATQMTVSHSYAHLREKPTTKSALLATLKHGTKVEVLDKVDDGKWTHVKVAGKEGYISTSLLK
ncbi:MAG TPA: SH3 domain-containing protein [Verrucomicrobiae bacterium]|jgi:uncharacterized protein YgiM (DUF1202 family)|nr:SH3 domain-containing protein [Verrucomicrobiae bacterium]